MASGTWGCTSKTTSPQHQLQQPNKQGLPAAVPTEEAQVGHCGGTRVYGNCSAAHRKTAVAR